MRSTIYNYAFETDMTVAYVISDKVYDKIHRNVLNQPYDCQYKSYDKVSRMKINVIENTQDCAMITVRASLKTEFNA